MSAAAADVEEAASPETAASASEEPRGLWRGMTPVTAALLVGLLGLALGFAAGTFTASPGYPGEDSAEAGFARDMSTHHGQAVEMSMVAWQRASYPRVRQVGYDIAVTQQGQIGIMQTWMDTWNVSYTSSEPAMSWMDGGHHMLGPGGRMPGMASPKQLKQLQGATGTQLDIMFCKLMIEHHLGGVHMAEAIVDRTDRTEVAELAQSMIDAQKGEISLLRDLIDEMEAK
ncbi:MAG: DUF305 domain-containing protein [Micromonosporaceae bacterium]